MPFTPEQLEQFKDEIADVQKQALQKYQTENPMTVQRAAEYLNQNGGKAYLSEEAYKQSVQATIGNIDRKMREEVKSFTGLGWNDGESFSDYYQRSTNAKIEKDLAEKQGNTSNEYKALQTSLDTLKTEKEALEGKVKEYQAESWNRKVDAVRMGAIKGKQFFVPEGVTGEYADIIQREQQNKYKELFDQKFELVEENGTTFLKDKMNPGSTYSDVNKAIGEWLPNTGIKFAESSSSQKPDTAFFQRGSENSLAALGRSREKAREALNKEGFYGHETSDPKVQQILKDNGLWDEKNNVSFLNKDPQE